MPGKFAFAAFVAALFAHSRFTAVQAQAHLQPRDTLPTQNNSTQDHILPHDDLDSTFFVNTSAPGAKSKRTLVAEPWKIKLTKISDLSQYTTKISVKLKDSWKYFDVACGTALVDHILLISQERQPHFDHTGLRRLGGTYSVPVFGGEGQASFYEGVPTKIGQVDLGDILVGALEKGGGVGDGVMPLARLAPHTLPGSSCAWQKLIGPKAGRKRVMAFALRPNGGEFHIGDIDLAAYNSIQYFRCDLLSPFWAIKDASIHIGGKQVAAERIIFDTTSQFIRGPRSMVEKLYKGIHVSITEFHKELGLYEIPCNTPTDKLISIRLTRGHVERWLNIGARLFIQRIPTHRNSKCFGIFAAHTMYTASTPEEQVLVIFPRPQPTDVVIGYAAMLDYYVVFNADDDTIGLGELERSYRFQAR